MELQEDLENNSNLAALSENNENERSSTPPATSHTLQRTNSRELKVEDALLYLDQVKVEFSDRPHIYNEFLEIMKNFKSQSITTPGVIDQVKQLFRGHNKLILGFNAFLPEGEGYKIELTPEEEAYPQYMQQQLAINYVTNIRNRFSEEPEIYQSFLKILHTYQREQNGIKIVLEQVSALFVDHPDLLMEFAYFLPDAVQDQAKERLARAVEEAEYKKAQRLRAEALNLQKGGHYRIDKEPKIKQMTELNQKKRKRLEQITVVNTTRKPQTQMSTERKFFDHVRDVLTNQSPEIWNEFVKCLDLFNRGAINRRGLLLLVSELFGPSNESTLDELKALLSARSTYDAAQQMDLWHSIPLNEIDFSQCRRCTPSYRMLPSDYMRPVCSAKIDYPESAVLNDDWVSIPIGSEENSSFKAKRKNQYEEALFRSEDDRYDIDMIIDSNSSCIRILEPIAEEISALKSIEDRDNPPRFAIQLERNNLGTIHLNAISRIYGDHGAEMLELLRRNPAGAIPVILKRLKQKDLEWRKARQQLNNQWRDILIKNAPRSLDHRSFYFRQQDKRSYSTRFLVADIKEPKPESINQLNSGVSLTCESSISSLTPDMNPNLYLTYHNKDHIFLRVVYNVLNHAVKNNSSIPPLEKENISMLWKNFFRIIFHMPAYYLYDVNSTLVKTKPKINSRQSNSNSSLTWLVGTRVLTLYGVGIVKKNDPLTGMHEVELSYGRSYLHYDSILGAESLSIASLEKIGVSPGSESDTETDLIRDVSYALYQYEYRVKEPCYLFFGTQMCYVFFRLHHLLTLRFAEAFHLAALKSAEIKEEDEPEDSTTKEFDMDIPDSNNNETNDDNPHSDSMETPVSSTPNSSSSGARESVFSRFLVQLYALIDGKIDSSSYEDACRHILGNKSYVLHTLDKIIQQSVKCLQALSSDETTSKLIGIFTYHRLTNGGTNPALYQGHVNVCLRNTLEEVYRLQFVSKCSYNYHADTVLACQYLGSMNRNGMTTNTIAPQLVLPDDEEEDLSESREDASETPSQIDSAAGAGGGSSSVVYNGGVGSNASVSDTGIQQMLAAANSMN